jgi:hypothetical protein
MIGQSNLTTRPRELDYVELHWLEKTTGRPSHDWDLYVVKELLDNALDADELWARKEGKEITLDIQLVYNHQPELDIYTLDIAVSNSAPFPTDSLSSIFDFTSYASSKSHYKYPSRGQQGNALKTLLGIPYALRREFYGDYNNLRKPLEIETGNRSFDVSLDIDEYEQKASLIFQPPVFLDRSDKTSIRVRIDRFVQEKRRTTNDLLLFARRFALLNPHVSFHWQVLNSGERSQWDFERDKSWSGRFNDTAPVHWYEYAQLKELLLAIERERGQDEPLARVLQVFAGFTADEDPDGKNAKRLSQQLGFSTVGSLRLAENHTQTLRDGLVPALTIEGRRVSAEELGGLGSFLTKTLGELFSLKSSPQYRRIVYDSPTDPAHPFVLEIALAHLSEGKRVIWTGLNHTPTYEDPFYTKAFYLPNAQKASVYGLDGFLDAYGQTADQPTLLVVHIVCPNLAFQDFSKTIMETRPFREPVTEALHQMLTEYRASNAPQVENLQQLVHELLPKAIQMLTLQNRQRYSGSQLLHAVRRLLAKQLHDDGRQEFADTWLNDPAANSRLQGYIQTYATEHQTEMAGLIQIERGRLSLPVHPDGFKPISLNVIKDLDMQDACVNKILLVSEPELEAIITFNGLLPRFDAAILQLDDTFDACFEALLPHLRRFNLPLALLHHATAADCLLFHRLRTKLDASNLQDVALYDIGLKPAQGLRLGLLTETGSEGTDRASLAKYLGDDEIEFLIDQKRQISLFSFPLDQMINWLENRFVETELSPKFIPSAAHLRTTALSLVKKSVTDWVRMRLDELTNISFLSDQAMEMISSDFGLNDLLARLEPALDEDPLKSWRMISAELIQERLSEILVAKHDQLTGFITKKAKGL